MQRDFYFAPIASFLDASPHEVLGAIFQASTGGASIEIAQRDAWREQITILQRSLTRFRDRGSIIFEYTIPRVGKRVDVVLLIDAIVFVVEFKVGERDFTASALDQVWDYALDLKNFHENTHDAFVAPILVATRAGATSIEARFSTANDRTLEPIRATPESLAEAISITLRQCAGTMIDPDAWRQARYRPTPTMIEAATALYSGHNVEEISRSDAAAINLRETSDTLMRIIRSSKEQQRKSICFVTGVPGAGKTLVGLNIATKNFDHDAELYSVFLSGNGPLVEILREALARDKVRNEQERGQRVTKSSVLSEVKTFIQNIHHFRDDCLSQPDRAPVEHVALFDEAQRAWNLLQTSNFMRRKKNHPDFDQSEPEFLISCLDRHRDWAVIVCLVGGGQEINTGEAGIGEWIDSLNRSFPTWHVYISSRLADSEYAAGEALRKLEGRERVSIEDHLHLGVSMRSFRAEEVSGLIKQILDLNVAAANRSLESVRTRYPIVLTRDLSRAKQWLHERARGSERYGIVASSSGYRLKPFAIDVKSPTDPVHWFLNGKDDVRSSFYLEEVATEFQVQGLEVDWACVAWDADLRIDATQEWAYWSFSGTRWQRHNSDERRNYLKNAYRVLLTRARQGMVIFVPEGDLHDATRPRDFYDGTFGYLKSIGLTVI